MHLIIILVRDLIQIQHKNPQQMLLFINFASSLSSLSHTAKCFAKIYSTNAIVIHPEMWKLSEQIHLVGEPISVKE